MNIGYDCMVSKYLTLVLIIICITFSGCGTVRSERVFDRASAGMSKGEAVKRIGHPAVVRGTFKNKDGQTIEVWEYRVGRGKNFEQVLGEAASTGLTIGCGGQIFLKAADTDRCWVYFVQDKFAGWTPAGDWARDTDRMCEMRFGTRSQRVSDQ